MAEWLGTVTQVIGSLFGVGVIAGGIAYFVSKLVSDGVIESHKASLTQETERLKAQLTQEGDELRLALKKQELVFARELEAYAAFMKLQREVSPRYAYPGMEFDDACDRVAGEFEAHAERMEVFLQQHGVVVSRNVRAAIKHLGRLAEQHKFDGGPEDFSREAMAAAGEIIEALPKIEEQLVTDIRTWEVKGNYQPA